MVMMSLMLVSLIQKLSVQQTSLTLNTITVPLKPITRHHVTPNSALGDLRVQFCYKVPQEGIHQDIFLPYLWYNIRVRLFLSCQASSARPPAATTPADAAAQSPLKGVVANQLRKLMSSCCVLRVNDFCVYRVSTSKRKQTPKEFVSGNLTLVMMMCFLCFPHLS